MGGMANVITYRMNEIFGWSCILRIIIEVFVIVIVGVLIIFIIAV